MITSWNILGTFLEHSWNILGTFLFTSNRTELLNSLFRKLYVRLLVVPEPITQPFFSNNKRSLFILLEITPNFSAAFSITSTLPGCKLSIRYIIFSILLWLTPNDKAMAFSGTCILFNTIVKKSPN